MMGQNIRTKFNKANVEAFNRVSIANNNAYTPTNLGIKSNDEETHNIISTTFGMIKHNLDAFWNSIGFDPNVNIAYEQAMMDPNKSFEADGRIYYQHPGVGTLKAYNEMGNPSGGCFTIQIGRASCRERV